MSSEMEYQKGRDRTAFLKPTPTGAPILLSLSREGQHLPRHRLTNVESASPHLNRHCIRSDRKRVHYHVVVVSITFPL